MTCVPTHNPRQRCVLLRTTRNHGATYPLSRAPAHAPALGGITAMDHTHSPECPRPTAALRKWIASFASVLSRCSRRFADKTPDAQITPGISASNLHTSHANLEQIAESVPTSQTVTAIKHTVTGRIIPQFRSNSHQYSASLHSRCHVVARLLYVAFVHKFPCKGNIRPQKTNQFQQHFLSIICHYNAKQIAPNIPPVVVTLLAIAFLSLQACSAKSIHLERYLSLHKSSFHGTAEVQTLSQYNMLRKGPPKRFFEIAAFPATSPFHLVANSVFRLDILYENEVDIDRTAECTATAIAPGVLMTNYHCVPGFQEVSASRLRIVRDYLSPHQKTASIVEEIPKIIDGDRKLDWVLLQYSNYDSNTYVEMNVRPPIKGESIFLIGHPLGQVKILSTGGCIVEEIHHDSLLHNCATLLGQSGSLIISVTDRSVLGIHAREVGSSNYAYRLDRIRSNILSRGTLPYFGRQVTTPTVIDTSGWALSEVEFESAVRQALKGDDPRGLLSILLTEATDIRQKLGSRRFVDLVVESGSVELLRTILADEEFQPRELGGLLSLSIEIYNSYDAPDTSMGCRSRTDIKSYI